jgi:hypothetical protein
LSHCQSKNQLSTLKLYNCTTIDQSQVEAQLNVYLTHPGHLQLPIDAVAEIIIHLILIASPFQKQKTVNYFWFDLHCSSEDRKQFIKKKRFRAEEQVCLVLSRKINSLLEIKILTDIGLIHLESVFLLIKKVQGILCVQFWKVDSTLFKRLKNGHWNWNVFVLMRYLCSTYLFIVFLHKDQFNIHIWKPPEFCIHLFCLWWPLHADSKCFMSFCFWGVMISFVTIHWSFCSIIRFSISNLVF